MNEMNPLTTLIDKMDIEPQMAYESGINQGTWYNSAYHKLVELTGYDKFTKVDANVHIEFEKDHENYREIRFLMSVETNCILPCHLLLPKHIKNPPLMICLQGHTTGMHISLGNLKYDNDEIHIAEGQDFAIQAISRGYAALCIEQRGFGERTEHPQEAGTECHVPAMTELLLGRTMIGGRAWDVSRTIDVIEENFKEININQIYLMGHSGGGTATFYTTCLEPRIKAAISSCSICTYKHSIAKIKHCVCNHIPSILKYFDMADLAGLIAPRPFVIVAGKEDEIFPLEGTQLTFEKIKQIYNAVGAKDNCKLVIGNGGHRFFPEEAWKEFELLMKG